MPNSIFVGVREKWLPLYLQIRDMAINKVGLFDEHMTTSAVLWKHKTTFAEVSAKKDYMVIAFFSDKLHEEWKPSKSLQTSKNRIVHYFEVTDNASFQTLIEYITQSYALTKP